jgi:hypothetical protein
VGRQTPWYDAGENHPTEIEALMSRENYVRNVVACKLLGLVQSPTELMLGLAIFEELTVLGLLGIRIGTGR